MLYIFIVDTNGTPKLMSPNDFLSYNMKGKVIKTIALPARDASYKYESYKVNLSSHFQGRVSHDLSLDNDKGPKLTRFGQCWVSTKTK